MLLYSSNCYFNSESRETSFIQTSGLSQVLKVGSRKLGFLILQHISCLKLLCLLSLKLQFPYINIQYREHSEQYLVCGCSSKVWSDSLAIPPVHYTLFYRSGCQRQLHMMPPQFSFGYHHHSVMPSACQSNRPHSLRQLMVILICSLNLTIATDKPFS